MLIFIIKGKPTSQTAIYLFTKCKYFTTEPIKCHSFTGKPFSFPKHKPGTPISKNVSFSIRLNYDILSFSIRNSQ